jgi:hypothetical protein
VFGPTMADNANLKWLPSPKRMAGGFATTKTDSAQFSIKTRLTKETASSVQKRRQLLPPHAQRIVFRRGDAHQQSRSNRSRFRAVVVKDRLFRRLRRENSYLRREVNKVVSGAKTSKTDSRSLPRLSGTKSYLAHNGYAS